VLSADTRGWLLRLVRLHLLELRLPVLLLTVLRLRVWLWLLPGHRRTALLLTGIVLPSGHADSPVLVRLPDVTE
jgi:hypothetical protein